MVNNPPSPFPRSDVIAMMTQEVERGRVKCHCYWPERVSCPLDTGRFQLSLENQQIKEYFHIKIIRMVEKEVRGKEGRSKEGTAQIQSTHRCAGEYSKKEGKKM